MTDLKSDLSPACPSERRFLRAPAQPLACAGNPISLGQGVPEVSVTRREETIIRDRNLRCGQLPGFWHGGEVGGVDLAFGSLEFQVDGLPRTHRHLRFDY